MPEVSFFLNGHPRTADYEEGMNLLQVLREVCGITSPKDGCSPQTGIPGFSMNVDRVFYQDDEEVKRETIRTFYRAAPEVKCGKKPKKDKDKEEGENAGADEAQPGDPGAPAGDQSGAGQQDQAPAAEPDALETVPAEEVAVG